jgi:hypothetical protein
MAGFDKVDPVNPCIICSGAPVRAWTGPHMTAGWVSKPYREMPARGWTREIQWSKNTPCTGEPESQARGAC